MGSHYRTGVVLGLRAFTIWGRKFSTNEETGYRTLFISGEPRDNLFPFFAVRRRLRC